MRLHAIRKAAILSSSFGTGQVPQAGEELEDELPPPTANPAVDVELCGLTHAHFNELMTAQQLTDLVALPHEGYETAP